MSETSDTLAEAVSEQDIRVLVERFYQIALDDKLLGPMFRKEIGNFDEHYAIVHDFWSHVLLGTKRYQRGTPYAHHTHLKVEEAHFEHWMTAFRQAAEDTLPPVAIDLALKRAEHMTRSFKMGLLPLPGARASAVRATQ